MQSNTTFDTPPSADAEVAFICRSFAASTSGSPTPRKFAPIPVIKTDDLSIAITAGNVVKVNAIIRQSKVKPEPCHVRRAFFCAKWPRMLRIVLAAGGNSRLAHWLKSLMFAGFVENFDDLSAPVDAPSLVSAERKRVCVCS